MASHSQTQSDLIAGSVSLPHTMNDISLGPSPPTHNVTDRHFPFPLMPPPVSPLQAGDFYRNRPTLSNASLYDLNIPFDMNRSLDQDLLFPNDLPLFDYPLSDFPGMGSGCESMMNSYHVGSSLPHLDSASDANMVNFNSVSRSDMENFHRTPTHFRGSGFRRPISNISSESCDNQTQVNAPQIDNIDRLDGRFLSLGFQSNPSASTNSTVYRAIPSDMCESPFSHRGQLGNYSHDNIGRRLGGFQNNVRDLGTPLDISGNLNLQNNHSEFQGMTSTFGVPPVPILPRGQVNMQHLMPNPRKKIPELRKETGSRISSSVPFERGMQRVPFNSSALRSNHQNAADPLQMSYLRTNKGLPLPVETGGGFVRQNNPGKIAPPNVASYAGPGVGSKMSDNRVPQSANQGATIPRKNQILRSSTAIAREPLKRNLDSPQQAMMRYQRRKVADRSSSHMFSSNLLQNAVGQVTTEGPTNTKKMPERPSTSQAAFIPPTHFSGISSAFSGPTAFANTPSISMVSPAGPTPTPVPTYAPTNLTHRRTGVASRNVATPSPTSLRKSSHVLSTSAKSSPPYAALQSPPMPPHIKWQVSDTPPTHGLKCMICKRDLSYAPERPMSVPPVPPPVAVLPCGHTFHDQCLLQITPDDQLKDPPCIPCAIPEY